MCFCYLLQTFTQGNVGVTKDLIMSALNTMINICLCNLQSFENIDWPDKISTGQM